MSPSVPFFRNAIARISYEPAGYIRVEWQPVAAAGAELRSIYEQVLQAMRFHGTTQLLSIHNQRPPLTQDVQSWLTREWIPRAIKEAGYDYCAVVEAHTPLSRLAARTIGASLRAPLRYEYFSEEAEAVSWLQEA